MYLQKLSLVKFMVSKSTIYKMIRNKEISEKSYVKIGKLIFIDVENEEIKKLLKKER